MAPCREYYIALASFAEVALSFGKLCSVPVRALCHATWIHELPSDDICSSSVRSTSSMETLTLTAGFDADSRPTCLVDLHAADRPWSSRIVYQNPALQRQCSSHFLDELSDSTHPTGAAAWIHDYNNRGSISARDGASPHHTYIIRERWRVIQWRETASRKQSLLAERDSALADRDAATQKLETLRHMMETINVGMFEYDWKGKLLWGNEAFYKLSGHPRESKSEEITWEQSVFPEDHAWLLTQWQQMAAGKSVTLEMRWRKTPHTGTAPEVADKGDEQWVVATCVPMFDETGEVVSVTGCLTDIDRLKRTEFNETRKKNEALEQAVASEHRLSAFADMTNIGIWMMDLNDKVSLVSTVHADAHAKVLRRFIIAIENGSLLQVIHKCRSTTLTGVPASARRLGRSLMTERLGFSVQRSLYNTRSSFYGHGRPSKVRRCLPGLWSVLTHSLTNMGRSLAWQAP